ncbi:hypothetical protein HYZ98_01685 [Candidatus Peregrinibacteria bacterium]|nr:hypothetical protein [Candidatus Peregrinibacteria bacterium]
MWNALRWFRRLLSDEKVVALYKDAGGAFGMAVSFLYMGECIGFKRRLERWAFWEREYARRGYRTIPIDDFVAYGGYGRDIESTLLVQRAIGEKPVYHAEDYPKWYLRTTPPVMEMEKVEMFPFTKDESAP